MRSDWPSQCLLGLVKGYRLLLSPALGSSCRFEPSCSAYALGALERHGALAGSYLTLKRLGRCHPWCEGGMDAVPDVPPALFSRLLHGPSHGPELGLPPSASQAGGRLLLPASDAGAVTVSLSSEKQNPS